DRDLRNRVLAEGLGPDTPVAQVASRPLRTLEARTPLYAAWTWLLEQGVHHAPLTRAGEVVGLLSSGDLMRASQYGPVALLRRVERLPSREALAGYAGQVAAMAGSLLSGGLEALVIAGLVARLNDALLRRLLSLAERELGPPPAPYAWLVLGSEGRMEQTLLTDQDNALVYADAGAAARPWFQALAERMSADLLAAGFPLCPGGFMARSWHGTLSEWEARFGAWADSPQPQALLEAAVFLDFRRAAGALSLEPLERARTRMRERVPFLRGLARTALDFKPPPLLLLRLRGAQGEVDLKAHGIVPVVGLARCYGLEAGGPQRPTLARLEAAARAGLTDADGVERVAEAYRFLLGLRLRLQLRRPDGTGGARVRLAELTPLERARLKESLHEVRAFQERAERHYQVEG
ncbi:MAG TPA: DUF294 nucleotidyltransferase-like domain-containing protein, partial [Aggregicoccus sp.]|nr:DUF294 nucleotidyltransferase-like domain-containing protein [Aggregicoccus sp.]